MSASFLGASHLIRQGVARTLVQRLSALASKRAKWLHSHGGVHSPYIERLTTRGQRLHRCNASDAQLRQQSSNTTSIYSNPELYDRAFALRDFNEEVDFLETIFKSCVKSDSGSFLELGCGPARHAALLQVKTQSTATAIDNVPQMLDYAQKVAAEAGASIHFHCEDMRSFSLQEPVDMAFMLLGTFSHLLNSKSALQCLRSVHGALKPAGKLVLELSHPTDMFNGSLVQEDEWDSGADCPTGPAMPGELAVQYGSNGDEFDAIDQVIMRTVQIYEGNQKKQMQKKLVEVVPQRIYTYQEMNLLASMSRFKLAAAYGDMHIDMSIRNEDAERMLLVLERL